MPVGPDPAQPPEPTGTTPAEDDAMDRSDDDGENDEGKDGGSDDGSENHGPAITPTPTVPEPPRRPRPANGEQIPLTPRNLGRRTWNPQRLRNTTNKTRHRAWNPDRTATGKERARPPDGHLEPTTSDLEPRTRQNTTSSLEPQPGRTPNSELRTRSLQPAVRNVTPPPAAAATGTIPRRAGRSAWGIRSTRRRARSRPSVPVRGSTRGTLAGCSVRSSPRGIRSGLRTRRIEVGQWKGPSWYFSVERPAA